MSFFGDLGQRMLDQMGQNSPVANAIIGRYKRKQMQGPDMTGDQMVDAMGPIESSPRPEPPVNPIPQPTLQSPQMSGPFTPQASSEDPAQQAAMSQWNQPDQAKRNGLLSLVAPGLAGGSIVTKPTTAIIGEKGPEAVVPLTPRSTNKLQPDLLEGHINPPKAPGFSLSRYRHYNRFARSGGA